MTEVAAANRAAVLYGPQDLRIEERPVPAPAAISLAASGKVDLDGLVSRHFGLDEAETALRLGRTDPAAIKAVVHPS
jgi:Zn-dependent alcohol dehydrogenase